MKGTALAFLALLVVAGEGRGDGNTVKLCGRDFVRAVVFTCGGSRWKRHWLDSPYLLEKDHPLPSSPEDHGSTSSRADAEQRLEADSKEIPPGMEQDLQGARKSSGLGKREAAKLLTTSCCSVGCSKREISSLC
ncbi:PREDICTED: relaxin-3 [Merops nubicus]|nr:PREDICTED: relaxin-3 [Merops nubicus]